MSQDELTQAMDETCERLIVFLSESNIPADAIHPLRQLVAEHQAEEVLEMAENLGFCMAYMQHDRLVRLLKAGWKAACNYKALQRKKAYKALAKLASDSKADPEELSEATRKKDDIDHECALANLKLYKLQVLHAQLEEELEAAANSTSAPED
ncbi:hypothetical protein M885DRAFT_504597 [Pelagophyceae sp. CCMP2097]|nr:hypothetical protein M885DRAFT_504597 [Pelagophyceae sp. CCMP2097]